MPESRDTNLWSECWIFLKLQDQLVPVFQPPSLPSTLSIVTIARFSLMGRPDALPCDRSQKILGICRRYHFTSCIFSTIFSSSTPITTIHSRPTSDIELSAMFSPSLSHIFSLMHMPHIANKYSKSIFLISIATYEHRNLSNKTNIFSITLVYSS